jgi:Rrf2 family protein
LVDIVERAGMKLSKRGEYGIKAMIDLASGWPERPVVQIKDIAEHEQIPAKFLEQILLLLKHAGLLQSKAGSGGGYHLAKPPSEITLGQIVRVLDGPLAPIRCVSKMAYERCVCPDENTCGLRLVMLDVRNAIAAVLDHTSLADVAAREAAAQRAKESQPAETP